MRPLLIRMRRRLDRHHREAGLSAAVELAILAPAAALFLGLLLFAGRLHTAETSTLTAAQEAARAASTARTAPEAQAQATTAAETTLSSSGLTCTTTSVQVDTSDLALPAGATGQITATISCTVPLADITLPGIPGQREITAEASSVIDTYRER